MDFAKIGDIFDRDLSLEELIQLLYGLNYLEFEIFELIVFHKQVDSESLQHILKRKDRVGINKTLKKLTEMGVVQREKNSVEGKPGYHYVYTLPELPELREVIKNRYMKWHDQTMLTLEALDTYYNQKFKRN